MASVTSASVSIPSSFVRSALVIMAPDPALVISLRSAAAIVMSALPSKLFPAISLAVDNLVAVAALPVISPVIPSLTLTGPINSVIFPDDPTVIKPDIAVILF